MRIKKGDEVEVIAGKDIGKRGEVLNVDREKDRVMVEGINIVHRHTQPSRQNQQGGIVENEAPIHVSNVQLICPSCGEKTRIGADFMDDGTKVRVCKKCNEIIRE